MPLNSSPPTIDGAAFDAKLRPRARAPRASTSASGAGWCPGNLEHLEELAERGVIGFKAFMSNSGIDEFAHADDVTLYEGMAIARAARAARRRARRERRADRAAARGPSARDWLASRPVVAELEAIAARSLFAEDTGCALHIVHVSSGRGVALVSRGARARRRRDLRDLPALPVPDARTTSRRSGAVAKCAPPVRDATEQRGAVGAVCAGRSTWSPPTTRPPRRSSRPGDFGDAWGGIAGAPDDAASCCSGRSSRERRRAADRGRRRRALRDRRQGPDRGRRRRRPRARRPRAPSTRSRADDLRYRHRISPWVGRRLRGPRRPHAAARRATRRPAPAAAADAYGSR